MLMVSSLVLVVGGQVLHRAISFDLELCNRCVPRVYVSVKANCSKRTRLSWPALYQNFTGDSGITPRGSPEIWMFFPGPSVISTRMYSDAVIILSRVRA